MQSAPNPEIAAMLLDIARPDGVPARTAVVMGSVDNARERLRQCRAAGMTLEDIAPLALLELGKILDAKAAYDKALGL